MHAGYSNMRCPRPMLPTHALITQMAAVHNTRPCGKCLASVTVAMQQLSVAPRPLYLGIPEASPSTMFASSPSGLVPSLTQRQSLDSDTRLNGQSSGSLWACSLVDSETKDRPLEPSGSTVQQSATATPVETRGRYGTFLTPVTDMLMDVARRGHADTCRRDMMLGEILRLAINRSMDDIADALIIDLELGTDEFAAIICAELPTGKNASTNARRTRLLLSNALVHSSPKMPLADIAPEFSLSVAAAAIASRRHEHLVPRLLARPDIFSLPVSASVSGQQQPAVTSTVLRAFFIAELDAIPPESSVPWIVNFCAIVEALASRDSAVTLSALNAALLSYPPSTASVHSRLLVDLILALDPKTQCSGFSIRSRSEVCPLRRVTPVTQETGRQSAGPLAAPQQTPAPAPVTVPSPSLAVAMAFLVSSPPGSAVSASSGGAAYGGARQLLCGPRGADVRHITAYSYAFGNIMSIASSILGTEHLPTWRLSARLLSDAVDHCISLDTHSARQCASAIIPIMHACGRASTSLAIHAESQQPAAPSPLQLTPTEAAKPDFHPSQAQHTPDCVPIQISVVNDRLYRESLTARLIRDAVRDAVLSGPASLRDLALGINTSNSALIVSPRSALDLLFELSEPAIRAGTRDYFADDMLPHIRDISASDILVCALRGTATYEHINFILEKFAGPPKCDASSGAASRRRSPTPHSHSRRAPSISISRISISRAVRFASSGEIIDLLRSYLS